MGTITQARNLILKAKEKLINKANKTGLYENFGDDESRMLIEKLGYNPYGTTDERTIASLISNFETWCYNYEG